MAVWYHLTIRTPYDAQCPSADVHVPPSSPWFNGHFPGHPILPGVAQLGMVLDVLRHAREMPLRVVEVSRVRFKQMVLPDDHLVVTAEARPGKNDNYSFRISKDEVLVCSGNMVVAAAGAKEAKDSAKGE
ncbi:3-hydroxyacyl-ACP dehydratase FabZ family protein [Desulfatitalea alkaliphila]|uniref:Polyketide synthase dehydratase domain-containing protein n=1 Tax=Desulfatitalea alkaliphila TaxID=2929485 RepID=A0AA41R649_9BACT|nr:FabA/FabZ family ACP-dehydratase [Desulfatitalea alkaliphila]MCJ8501596.1 polyketide synthase dehydratase domain-containing protein [Desulfatitalea alkaliphila]